MEFLKANTQLSYTQIYKWGWDQKKKVERNPNAKKVPTIDEFGGYCKFEASQKQSISKVLDIDWNEKIRLLDLECEREEMQMKPRNIQGSHKRGGEEACEGPFHFVEFECWLLSGHFNQGTIIILPGNGPGSDISERTLHA